MQTNKRYSMILHVFLFHLKFTTSPGSKRPLHSLYRIFSRKDIRQRAWRYAHIVLFSIFLSFKKRQNAPFSFIAFNIFSASQNIV